MLARSRAALLDALEALDDHRDSVIVIGAQAIYLRTASAPVNLAEATKDSDLAVDPRYLDDDPLIEVAMTRARFYRDPTAGQPGAWMNPEGIPVDLMVPETFAGPGGATARSARVPPHDRGALRRARGLEAVLVDNDVMNVAALDPTDQRSLYVRVAGSAALLVAKAHKIGERAANPGRLVDKDAHDIYRILIDVDTAALASSLRRLLEDEVSRAATKTGLKYLGTLFADGPQALGPVMAGRAEEGVGEPETVALAVSILTADLLAALPDWRSH
jgi:hypothetical protein